MSLQSGSIIDLKAELARKEENAKKNKAVSESTAVKGKRTLDKLLVLTGRSKQSRQSKKLSKVDRPIQKNESEEAAEAEQEKKLLESRQKLEAKCRLYERMQTGDLEDSEEENGESKYLVDFHKKSIADEEVKNLTQKEDWVEFTDSFGRQRKCKRKDLHEFKEMDADIVVTNERVDPAALLAQAEASQLEQLHEKWDDEEERHADGPTHYENVKFDEVRQLGVGYYQFSKDEESRQQEMEMLDKLRSETVDQRKRQENLKERKKQLMSRRLASIKERRALKRKAAITDDHPGYTPSNNQQGSDATVETAERPVNISSHHTDNLLLPSHGIARVTAGSQHNLMAQRREERWSDFAPPQAYSSEQPTVKDDIDDFLSFCRS